MSDASSPPEDVPGDTHIVAGYIGGNTGHVWTREQWAHFGRLKKLPIFVRNSSTLGNGSRASGVDDAFAALRMLDDLRVPKGSTVVYDMETLIYGALAGDFWLTLRKYGYYTWLYGSARYVLQNPPCSGYWAADWDDVPKLYHGQHVVAKQYAANVDGWDLSVVTGWQVTHRIKTW
jgi:hypothetical protein